SWRSDPKGWELLDGSFVPKRGTSICESAPDDPCCVPCGSELEAGCPEDPACADPYVHEGEGQSNLRCFEQKRRFGRDSVYPIERYRNAVSEPRLCLERADLKVDEECADIGDNPLFFDLVSGGPAVRTPEAVFVTFIVGVPWHDLATDPFALADPAVEELGYKSAEALERDGTYELLIGDSL